MTNKNNIIWYIVPCVHDVCDNRRLHLNIFDNTTNYDDYIMQ